MLIGGIHRFSLIDYPEKTACVVFTQGCNLRCPFCHNPELIEMGLQSQRLFEQSFFKFLEERRGKLDAVVITGGEPCLQADLTKFIEKVRKKGFLVKLDTNGTDSKVLEELLNKKIVSYIAMDVKGPLKNYSKYCGLDLTNEKISQIEKNIKLIMQANIPYEFRTTVIKELHSEDEILKTGDLLKGAELYVLQHFIPSQTYSPAFRKASSLPAEKLQSLALKLEKKGIKKVIVR